MTSLDNNEILTWPGKKSSYHKRVIEPERSLATLLESLYLKSVMRQKKRTISNSVYLKRVLLPKSLITIIVLHKLKRVP